MSSWLVWGVFAFAAVCLGWVGYHFTVRTLRLVTLAFVVAVAGLVTGYGARHLDGVPADVVHAFTRGMDGLSGAFFQPLLPGQHAFVPGRVGWLVIIAVLVFAYRELEVWAMRWQPPTVDTSALGSEPGAQQDSGSGGGPEGRRDHDDLVAELRFRLPAVEVRAPPILPGGTTPSGLASIAENSGMAGSGLAGAIIRLAGMLWPSPRRYQVRVWVKPAGAQPAAGSRCGLQATEIRRVTVDLEDTKTGRSIATKTLPARNLSDAAARVAAYVARQIFRQDPSAPAWSVGSFDGGDLAALLCAAQQGGLIDSPEDAHCARCQQIQELENAVCNSPGAGVARYELALLYDLERNHTNALWLHAINRRQYPRFFRGRYRLGMSLEMIANPNFGPLAEDDWRDLRESLRILDQCGVTGGAESKCAVAAGPLSPELRQLLLQAAADELRECQRQLTLWRLIWATFRHRDERAIRKPFWGLGERQRFQDGCQVAALLVAVRQRLNELERAAAGEPSGPAGQAGFRPRRALLITKAITGSNAAIQALLEPTFPVASKGSTEWHPGPDAGKTRWLPWQHHTPSWQAAYNAACLYAALVGSGHQPEEATSMALRCLERVVNDRHCEMERPSDWICSDPDLLCLARSAEFRAFRADQLGKDYPKAYPAPGHHPYMDSSTPTGRLTASPTNPGPPLPSLLRCGVVQERGRAGQAGSGS
jgi:hypothetical protein